MSEHAGEEWLLDYSVPESSTLSSYVMQYHCGALCCFVCVCGCVCELKEGLVDWTGGVRAETGGRDR